MRSVFTRKLPAALAVLVFALFGALLLACGGPQRVASQNPSAPDQAPAALETIPSAAPSAAAETSSSPFLWKVQGKSAVVFLLGSIHMATEALYPLDERIEHAFEQSDTLVLELDLGEEAQADAAQLMVSAALLPKGETVMEKLNGPTKTLLEQKLKALNVDAARVSMFKPWFVAVTISMLELEKSGFSPDYGIEKHFYNKAIGKKRLLALETVEDQLAAFQVLEEDSDSESLRLSLEIDSAKQIKEMIEIWQTGNVAALDALLDQSRAYPKVFDAMFTHRNQHMAQQVESYLADKGRYLVVAGAGHMVGKGSIIDVLRRSGHIVTRQ